ncbi:hypothetical protein AAKU67_001911 [Oxalobacteraceae bacterium GrIS 2.11]
MKPFESVFLPYLTALVLAIPGTVFANDVLTDTAPVALQFLDQDQELDLAVRAGPEHLRADATTYVFGAHGYTMVHKGSNGFHCLVNRDGQQNGDVAFRPTCWDPEGSATILPVVLRVGELLAMGKSSVVIKQDIDSGFSTGRFSSPGKAGIAYMLLGDLMFDAKSKSVHTLFPGHYMVYAPGVSNADIGFTAESRKNLRPLPFIYDGYSGGTNCAYLIILAAESRPASN